jgi:hypothetical protein
MMYSLCGSSLVATGAAEEDDASGSDEGESEAERVDPLGTETGSLLQTMLPTARSW